MDACLNPHGPHPVWGTSEGRLICTEPQCGFLLAGALIDRWQITSLLHQGLAGDLYLATELDGSHTNWPQLVVKVFRVPTLQPAIRVEALLERLLALNHPHIHPLQGYGWTMQGGALYTLSRYEDQGPLFPQSGPPQRLAPLAVIGIVRQLAEALHYAHSWNLVHGRLKPENCLIVAPATVQICDFYRCILAHEDDAVSPHFVAPEQALGQTGPAADQYSLALLAYQLLSAQLPFSKVDSLKGRAQFMQYDPIPLSQVRPDLPRQIDVVMRRALNRQPRERFPTMLEFAVAFQGALEYNPSLPGSFSEPSRPFATRPSHPPPAAPPLLSRPGPSPSAPPPSAIGLPYSKPARPFPTLQPTAVRVQVPAPGSATPLCILPGHTAVATVLDWAQDGFHLASAGPDQSIRLWRIQQRVGAPLAVLEGHSGEVRAVRWSPTAKLLASWAMDATIRIWDLAALIDQGTASGLIASPHSQAAWWGHDGSVAALDWSPDGMRLASGGTDRTIRLWDQAGNIVTAWQAHGRGGITTLAWSPDGRMLASGGADRQVMLWDALTGAQMQRCDGHGDEIRHLAWSPNGALLASSAGKKDMRIALWNPLSGQRVASIGGATRDVVGLFWSSDSAWLAAGSADRQVRFWGAAQNPGQPIGRPLEIEENPLSMAGAPTSDLIAFGLPTMMVLVLHLTA